MCHIILFIHHEIPTSCSFMLLPIPSRHLFLWAFFNFLLSLSILINLCTGMNTHSNQHQPWYQSGAKEAASNESWQDETPVYVGFSFFFFFSILVTFMYRYEHPLQPMSTMMTIRGQKSNQSQCWGAEVQHPFLWGVFFHFIFFFSFLVTLMFRIEHPLWPTLTTMAIGGQKIDQGQYSDETHFMKFLICFFFSCSILITFIYRSEHPCWPTSTTMAIRGQKRWDTYFCDFFSFFFFLFFFLF